MAENPVPPRIPPKIVPPRPGGLTPAKPAAPARPPVVRNPAPARPGMAAPHAAPTSPAAPVAKTTAPKEAPAVKPVAPFPTIVAGAATYYRTTRYIMVALLLGMSGWFAYDGWRGWPQENVRHFELTAELDKANKSGDIDRQRELKKDPLTLKTPHSEQDIRLQKILAIGLPFLALALLAWTRYNSRGQYRLANGILSVPGHPDVNLSEILEVDTALWDRKGIAYVKYQTPQGSGRLRLDDFIYEREPTDQIFELIKANLTGGLTAESTASS